MFVNRRFTGNATSDTGGSLENGMRDRADRILVGRQLVRQFHLREDVRFADDHAF